MDSQVLPGKEAGIPADYLQFYDELTGLYNRRFYNRSYPEECERAAAGELALGLVLVNVDHFRAINDRYGMEQGDGILVQVGALVNEVVGTLGFPVRYGGDEFVVLLPETPREGVVTLAQQIVQRAGSVEYRLAKSVRGLQLTVSAGVACFPDDVGDVHYLLDCAGQALYKARRGQEGGAGGNQVAQYLATDDPVLDKGTLQHFFPCPRFVGREPLVRGIVEAAPSWAVVAGPAGSGRTRVLEEVASQLEGRLLLRATGLMHRADQPFGLLLEAIETVQRDRPQLPTEIAAVLDPAELSALSRLLPWLARLTPGRGADTAALDMPPDPYVEGFLRVMGVLGDAAIIFDDVQWADRGTLLVLEAVRTRRPSVFTVLAVRTDDLEANRTLVGLMETWGESAYRALEPLDAEQVQEMIEAILPGEPTEQPALIAAIVERAQGRPLAVEETLKYLVQCQLLWFTQGALQVGDLAATPVPADDEALLHARVALINDEVREVVALAAMLGRVQDFETLKALVGREEGYVRGMLEQARKLHVVDEVWTESQELVHFESAALQRAIVRAMLPDDRQKAHAKVGRLLERMYAGALDGHLADLWWHFDQCGDLEKAQGMGEILRGYRAYRSPLGQDQADELKDLVTDAVLPEAMLTKAVDLARLLKIHLQNIRMYGADHVHRKGGFTEMKEMFDDIFSRTTALSFAEVDEQMLVNGNTLPTHLQYGTGILEQFQYYGIKGLTFRRGLNVKEIQTTLELMCLAKEEVRSRGGVAKMLADVGVVNVTVNEKVYVMVGDKDILVKNKQTGQEMLIKDLEGNVVDSPLETDELFTIFRARDHVSGDMGTLKDSLERVTALLSNLPTDGEGGGAALSEIDPAELRKLLDAQAEVAEWYKEIARYIDMNFLRALDRDWAVLARDMESGNRIKIAAASRAYLEGGEESMQPLVRLITATTDTRARRVAVSLLRKLDEDALDVLLTELFNAQLPDEKCHLLAALEDFQDASIAPKIEAFVQHPVREVRRAALHVLTTKGQGLMGQALLAALDSDREDVKADAINKMGEQKLLLAVPPLLNLIKGTTIFTNEGNENVQAQACQALGEIGDVRALDPLLALVAPKKGIFRSKASHVRAAATLALTNLVDRDSRERILDALERAADDKDVVVRSAAKVALDNLKRADEEAKLTDEERARRAELRRMEVDAFDPDAMLDGLELSQGDAEQAKAAPI